MTHHKGLTLLELLFTLLLMALVSTMAAPPLRAWYDNHQTRGLQTQLLHSFRLARNQAVASGSRVTVCPAADGQCQADWSGQLMVFVDSEGDGNRPSDAPLLQLLPLQSGGNLQWRSFRGLDYIQFDPRGMTPALNGTLHYCPGKPGIEGFALTVSRTGRTRVREPSC